MRSHEMDISETPGIGVGGVGEGAVVNEGGCGLSPKKYKGLSGSPENF